MIKQRVKELKQLVEGRGEHAEIQQFLSQHFDDTLELRETGPAIRDEVLEHTVPSVIFRMLGPVRVANLRLVQTSWYDCIQGEFKVGSRRGHLFYFEDIGVGLVCVFDSGGRIDTDRFRSEPLPVLRAS